MNGIVTLHIQKIPCHRWQAKRLTFFAYDIPTGMYTVLKYIK